MLVGYEKSSSLDTFYPFFNLNNVLNDDTSIFTNQ